MCPKKAKTVGEALDQLAILWLMYRMGVLQNLIERAKDVEKSSDKNTINTVSTVGKHGKGKRSLKGKSVKQ